MSSHLSDHERRNIEYNLNVISPPLSYIRQDGVDRFAIALCVEIPYPLLKLWHGIVDREGKEASSVDYLDLLNSWVQGKWFQVSRASGFRIQGRLRREICSVVGKYKKVSGTKKKTELDHKTLTLSILVNELVSYNDMVDDLNEANQLMEEWRQKFSDLEKEKDSLMHEMVQALEMKDREIESLNEDLAGYVEKISLLETEKQVSSCGGKPLQQLGERQKARRIKELKGKADLALWFLETYGLQLSSVKAKELDSKKTYTFDYQKENALENDKECVEQILFLLDKFCVSDELYHELTLAYNDLPRSYLVKQKRTELNNLCHIEKLPGKFPGAQLSFVFTLRDEIRDFLQSHPNHPSNEPIKVKISGDGAKMSRTTNFMILSFSILQTGRAVMSSKGNRTIPIVNGPEQYNTLNTSFRSIINEINNVIKEGEIEVDGKVVNLEMFLGGDYKFLLMATGLKGATSDYSCIWCKVHKLLRWDTTKDLEYYNVGELKRTLQEIKDLQGKNKYCCILPPLFNIELDHVILDELHLMLRISDRLTENLINEVMQRDSGSDFLKKRGEPTGLYLKQLVNVINNLGITFAVWEKSNADGNGSGVYDWTSLLGSDKKKLIALLPAQLESNDILFPETKNNVVKLWKDFGSLYQMINETSDNANQHLDVFQTAKKFIELFCSLGSSRLGYNRARVTPYMHALVYHVPMFLREYKSFKQFTGQGVEKNNDDAKRIFFQKSNKWDAARDVLQHESRQQTLKHHEREKRKYEKHNQEYWGNGIVDSRKKRLHSTRNHNACTSGSEAEEITLSFAEQESARYGAMTMKQLKQEIKVNGLRVKGISKMTKSQLIEVLKSY